MGSERLSDKGGFYLFSPLSRYTTTYYTSLPTIHCPLLTTSYHLLPTYYPLTTMGRGQFLITIGTNPYQNTYFIFFFTVFSYVFSLFSPVFQDLQNTPTEYNRIHCILNNTREYTQNTHRIHNVQKRRKVLFAQYTC